MAWDDRLYVARFREAYESARVNSTDADARRWAQFVAAGYVRLVKAGKAS